MGRLGVIIFNMEGLDKYLFFNEDCIAGCKKHIPDNSIDLIVTDPPYGIEGDELHKHYNRNENFVLDGYCEVPREEYKEFSERWIQQAERILRPGGSIYIVSGYTNLIHILNALNKTNLKEKNHIIWKYNFGVYTKTKYISSHYHILFYVKPGGKHTFNTFSRYGQTEKSDSGGSRNYQDREDVWIINREYKPGKIKNKNELPKKLLIKILQYSANEGDVVCDLFLGSFSTAKIALGLNMKAVGFEVSQVAFNHQIKEIENIIPGSLLDDIKKPAPNSSLKRQGLSWSEQEKSRLISDYQNLIHNNMSKKMAIQKLQNNYQRGYFSISKIIDKHEKAEAIQCELKL